MPKLRCLSGKEVITILQEFGFEIFQTEGSHFQMRVTVEGRQIKITIPDMETKH